MTKSSISQASDVPKRQPVGKPSFSRGRALLVFLFRLLLLGVSGSLAGLVGIAIAQFYPGRIQEPPLVEKFMQGSQVLWTEMNELPQSWRRSSPELPAPVASGSSAPTASPQTATPTLPPPPPPQLSDADRQQIQTELNQLQSQLQELNNRAVALETRVGTQNSTAPLEERLQAIERQLDPNAAPPSATPSPNPDQGFIAPATSTLSNGEVLKVTLPTDALFNADQTLRPETTAILDSLIGDLQRYPEATLRIGGHTDSQGSSDADRDRSFEQANAIAQYLSGQLDESYQWVVVGYGSSQPLAENTSPINRQRNRRIEIVIDPN